MKITIEIHDELLRRAKHRARKTGQSLREIVEDGLRLALEKPEAPVSGYRWEDLSVGSPDGPNPFEKYTWAEMLAMSYDRSPPG